MKIAFLETTEERYMAVFPAGTNIKEIREKFKARIIRGYNLRGLQADDAERDIAKIKEDLAVLTINLGAVKSLDHFDRFGFFRS